MTDSVDKRTDLWALGVVLMEMLTGRPVFSGETVSHVLAAVLTRDPDWTALPAETPVLIRRLLRRCLEKDRKRRWDSAAVAGLDIDDALSGATPDVSSAAGPVVARRTPLGWIVAAAVMTIVAGVALWAPWCVTRPDDLPLIRAERAAQRRARME